MNSARNQADGYSYNGDGDVLSVHGDNATYDAENRLIGISGGTSAMTSTSKVRSVYGLVLVTLGLFESFYVAFVGVAPSPWSTPCDRLFPVRCLMEKIVSFRGSGTELKIVFRSYERGVTSDPDDANWITAFAEISGPGAHLVASIGVTTRDLREMVEGLDAILAGRVASVDFGCLENQLGLGIEKKGSAGHFVVSARLETVSSARIRVETVFETDQSQLAESQRALQDVASTFPMRFTG